jgi:hypothetical protein
MSGRTSRYGSHTRPSAFNYDRGFGYPGPGGRLRDNRRGRWNVRRGRRGFYDNRTRSGWGTGYHNRAPGFLAGALLGSLAATIVPPPAGGGGGGGGGGRAEGRNSLPGGPIKQTFAAVVTVLGERATRVPLHIDVTLECDRSMWRSVMDALVARKVVAPGSHQIVRCTTMCYQANGRVIESKTRTAKLYHDAALRNSQTHHNTTPTVLNITLVRCDDDGAATPR